MKHYYINSKPDKNGFHPVHNEDCKHIPYPLHREALGIHASSFLAMAESKHLHTKSVACPFCLPEYIAKQKELDSTVDNLLKKAKANKHVKAFES